MISDYQIQSVQVSRMKQRYTLTSDIIIISSSSNVVSTQYQKQQEI